MANPEVVWPPRDPASVAPLNKDGLPHMFAYMPSGLVYRDEAIHRGWRYFFEGRACPSGHIAPRPVKNPSSCVDCDHIRSGRPTIGRVGPPEVRKSGRPPTRVPGRLSPTRAKNEGLRPVEPSKGQKAFLTAYAELKDFDAAAKKVGITPSVIESQLCYSPVFRDAFKALEERTGVRHQVNFDEDFEWDEGKEAFFIRTYVNTGLLESARDSIRVTNFDFEEHLKDSPDFAAQVKEAEPLAIKLIKGRALRAIMDGNPQAIIKALNVADFTIPDDPAAGMTDEQLDDELIRTLGLAKREPDAPAIADAESPAEVPAGADDQEDVPEAEPESFEDLL